MADRQFYARTEGSFSKIVRKGNSPSNYYWEVTGKTGTKYTYGTGNAVLAGTAKTLSGNRQAIAEWKLSRVEEAHGGWIEYIYETATEPAGGNLAAQAVYLKEVRAGNKNSPAHTVATFTNRVASKGAKAYIPIASTGAELGKTSIETSVYFADVNNDGVRVAIQVGSGEKWNRTIAKGDFTSYPATAGNINITKGQKAYFRLQAGAGKMSNGSFGWDETFNGDLSFGITNNIGGKNL